MRIGSGRSKWALPLKYMYYNWWFTHVHLYSFIGVIYIFLLFYFEIIHTNTCTFTQRVQIIQNQQKMAKTHNE